MPTITSIKPQRNGKRVNIYLDGKFGFGIDLENFVTLNLREGAEYTEEQIEEIIKKAEFQKTYDKLLRFAALRPRSEKEINDWFIRKKVHPSLHLKLLRRLKNLELVDDEKFAKWWVEQRLQFKSKSRRELEQELRIKGIEKEIITQILRELGVDEVKAASNLLKKNLYKFGKYDGRLARQKMAQFLARKGFGWEAIKKVIGEIPPEGCDPYL